MQWCNRTILRRGLMYLRGQCASRMSCKQPRYGTYLQLLSDGSSFELIHTIPESIPTPGASCGPCGASGYYGGLIFDEINGVHGVSVDMHDTTVTSTACTWPSCSPEAPETSEDNVDAPVDTPDTAVASLRLAIALQPGSGVTNANWASHCEMDPADQEIDAVHAGASALVAAVRAGRWAHLTHSAHEAQAGLPEHPAAQAQGSDGFATPAHEIPNGGICHKTHTCARGEGLVGLSALRYYPRY